MIQIISSQKNVGGEKKSNSEVKNSIVTTARGLVEACATLPCVISFSCDAGNCTIVVGKCGGVVAAQMTT